MISLLAIDTTTQSCSVALLHEERLTSRFQIAPRQHTELILPMINELLAERQLVCGDVEAIAFAAGPGSFMGTRLAVGVAQGLAYALSIPLIPVSTLHILAQTAYEACGAKQVLSGWDARMGEVYWGIYACDNGMMQPQQADQLSMLSAVTAPDDHYMRVGNIWGNDEAIIYPQATALITLAKPRFKAGEVISALAVEPIYLRTAVVKEG